MTVTERTNGGPSGAVINCNYPFDDKISTNPSLQKVWEPLTLQYLYGWNKKNKIHKLFDKQHFDAKLNWISTLGGAKELKHVCLYTNRGFSLSN